METLNRDKRPKTKKNRRVPLATPEHGGYRCVHCTRCGTPKKRTARASFRSFFIFGCLVFGLARGDTLRSRWPLLVLVLMMVLQHVSFVFNATSIAVSHVNTVMQEVERDVSVAEARLDRIQAAAGIGAPAQVGYRPWAVHHGNLFVPFICHVLGVAHNGFPRVRGAFLMVFGDENVLIRLALVYAASYAVRGITVGTVPWAVGHGPLSGDAYIAENDQYPLVEIDNVGHVQFQHYGMLARVAEVFFRLG